MMVDATIKGSGEDDAGFARDATVALMTVFGEDFTHPSHEVAICIPNKLPL